MTFWLTMATCLGGSLLAGQVHHVGVLWFLVMQGWVTWSAAGLLSTVRWCYTQAPSSFFIGQAVGTVGIWMLMTAANAWLLVEHLEAVAHTKSFVVEAPRRK